MPKFNSWIVRRADRSHVDTIFYTEDCDEQYIRSAEDYPEHYSLEKEE